MSHLICHGCSVSARDVHSIQKPDERKPVPVENDGREDQNKLVLANGKSPYIIGNPMFLRHFFHFIAHKCVNCSKTHACS